MRRLLLGAILIWGQSGHAESKITASISAPRNQFLYAGMDNSLDVTVCGTNCDNVLLVCDNGRIVRSEDCNFVITRASPGGTTIRMIRVLHGDTAIVQERWLPVRRIPSPVARVANKTGGNVSAAVFRAQLGVSAALENLDICASFRVKTFKIILLRQSGMWQEFNTNSGPYFSENMQDAIKTVDTGDRIIITDITADAVGIKDIKLEPIFLTIN
jgi:hypothetical protein